MTKQPISVTHPEIASTLHDESKHIADKATHGASTRALWKCQNQIDAHVHEARVADKIKGYGCPFCSGVIASVKAGNTLAQKYPKLLLELHEDSIEEAYKVTPGSNKKLTWICQEEDCKHVYEQAAKAKTKGAGCPACSGQVVTENNCLAKRNPQLLSQIHPDDLQMANEVIPGSTKKMRFVCPKVACGHVYETQVRQRAIFGHGCPACAGKVSTENNCLLALYPELCKEIEPGSEHLAKELLPGSEKLVPWVCPDCSHHYSRSPKIRALNKQNCPACRGLTVTADNCLATLRPDIAVMLHPDNAEMAYKVVPGSHKRLTWICLENDCDHIYEATVQDKVAGYGCAACSGNIASKTNNLLVCDPELAKELFHKEQACQVTSRSNRKLRWICPDEKCQYQYIASPKERANGRGCTKCTGIWQLSTTKFFLKDNFKEWSELDQEQQRDFFLDHGFLESWGRGRTLVAMLIDDAAAPIDFLEFINNKTAPFTQAEIDNHTSFRFGRKSLISASLKKKVKEEKGDRCLACGSKDRIAMDHKTPEILGGLTVWTNLQPLCKICNSIKGPRLMTLEQIKNRKLELYPL